MSGLGQCARKMAYKYHGVAMEKLDFKVKGNFDDGTLAHAQIRPWIRRGLIANKSCYRLVDQEKDVSVTGHGVTVGGHIDGFLKHRNSKCSEAGHDDMLLEVKSMNDMAFKRFKENGFPEFEYQCQVSGYLAALGLYKASIVAKNKNKFDLHETSYTRDDALLDNRLLVVASVKASADPEAVPREYKPDKYGVLPWQCNYCPFVMLCWRHEGVSQIKDHLYKVKL